MTLEKVKFTLPKGDGDDTDIEVEIEPSSAVAVDTPTRKTKAEPEEDDDLEIEVVDDVPEADRGRKAGDPPDDVTEEELGEYSERVQKRFKKLSKGYHDERREKEQAVRDSAAATAYAAQVVAENKKLKGSNHQGQTAQIEQAKVSLGKELAQAKRDFKEAYEAGDSEALANAQELISNTAIKLDKVNNFRLPALQTEETPVKREVASQPAATKDVKAADWAKNNTWFGKDDEMTSLALGLHTKLLKEGIDTKSDEYYERIDARMRKLFPDEFEGEAPTGAPAKRKSNVVAPASRSTAPQKVRLTQTQVSLAKRLGVPLEAYARQVAEDMRKEQ